MKYNFIILTILMGFFIGTINSTDVSSNVKKTVIKQKNEPEKKTKAEKNKRHIRPFTIINKLDKDINLQGERYWRTRGGGMKFKSEDYKLGPGQMFVVDDKMKLKSENLISDRPTETIYMTFDGSDESIRIDISLLHGFDEDMALLIEQAKPQEFDEWQKSNYQGKFKNIFIKLKKFDDEDDDSIILRNTGPECMFNLPKNFTEFMLWKDQYQKNQDALIFNNNFNFDDYSRAEESKDSTKKS